MKPLRVAVLAHVRHPIAPPFAGGMEAHSWHLAHALAERGHDVTLFASGDSTPHVRLQSIVAEHYERALPWSLHHGTPRLDAHLQPVFERACRALDDGHYDVIHNNSLHPLPIEHARRTGAAMVTSLHVPPFDRLRAAVQGPASPGMHYTVTSRSHRSDWWPTVPPSCASVVHNGIDPAAWPLREAADDGLVWAGRIAPNKGTHLAAAAARCIGRRLSIAGPIDDRNYFDCKVRPYLDERVRYCGHLAGTGLAELFGRSAALLFTPLWPEPFGLVAIEAMSCGLPVAYTGCGAAREVIGEAGVCARDNSPACLADALRRAEVIPRAVPRYRVQRMFSHDVMLDAYESLYRQCLVGASGGAARQRPRADDVAA